MSILVTGGNGFIGSNFIEHMLSRLKPDCIYNIDKKTSISSNWVTQKYADSQNYHEYAIDINSIESILKFSEIKIDDITHCIHFAAESHVDNSLSDITPFINSNISGTMAVARLCLKCGIKMIHMSTDEVYGHVPKGENFAFNVDDPLAPRNPYAASKAAAEMMLTAFKNVNPDFEYCVIRPSNQFGPRQDDTKFIPKLIKGLRAGVPFPMYGDGMFYREWTYVRDTCEIIRQIMNNDMTDFQIYNITSGRLLSNMAVFTIIFNIMKSHNPANESITGLVEFIHDPRGLAHDYKYAIENVEWINTLMINAMSFEDRIKEMLDERS